MASRPSRIVHRHTTSKPYSDAPTTYRTTGKRSTAASLQITLARTQSGSNIATVATPRLDAQSASYCAMPPHFQEAIQANVSVVVIDGSPVAVHQSVQESRIIAHQSHFSRNLLLCRSKKSVVESPPASTVLNSPFHCPHSQCRCCRWTALAAKATARDAFQPLPTQILYLINPLPCLCALAGIANPPHTQKGCQ